MPYRKTKKTHGHKYLFVSLIKQLNTNENDDYKCNDFVLFDQLFSNVSFHSIKAIYIIQ